VDILYGWIHHYYTLFGTEVMLPSGTDTIMILSGTEPMSPSGTDIKKTYHWNGFHEVSIWNGSSSWQGITDWYDEVGLFANKEVTMELKQREKTTFSSTEKNYNICPQKIITIFYVFLL
jgi:hypothetical protein